MNWQGVLSRSAVLVWALGFALIPTVVLAHNPDNYYNGIWTQNAAAEILYEFTQQVPGDGQGDFADRVADGAQEWNAVPALDLTFKRHGVTGNYDPFQSCSDLPPYKNGIHYRDINENPAASAKVCYHDGHIDAFNIAFDPSYSWYKGTAPGGLGPNEYPVWGMSAHEFGHATGGWLDNTPAGHFDSQANPGLCDDTDDRHTMCKNWATGQWRLRSLEAHDEETFGAAYPF